jgi:hypothetical protein
MIGRRRRSTTPPENDPALQPKAILIVIVAAERQIAVIAEAGVEILRLDEPDGKFPIHDDVKAATYRHGEGILAIRSAGAGSPAVATETEAIPTEVDFGKWLDPALVSIGKVIPAKFCSQGGNCLADIFAATQVGRYADNTTHVVRDRATATNAVKICAKTLARRHRSQ